MPKNILNYRKRSEKRYVASRNLECPVVMKDTCADVFGENEIQHEVRYVRPIQRECLIGEYKTMTSHRRDNTVYNAHDIYIYLHIFEIAFILW